MMDLQAIQERLIMQFEPPRFQKWLKIAIVASVFLLSFFVALNPTSRLTILIVALLVGSTAMLVFFKRPFWGLLALVFACMFIPSPLTGGAGALLSPPIIILVFMIGVWILDMLTRHRQIKFVSSRANSIAFIFLIVIVIAFINGQINYYNFAQLAPITAQIGGFAVFILSLGAFLLIANWVKDSHWLEGMIWLFLGSGAIYLLSRLTPVTERFIRPLFAYGSDASPFWVWMMAITSSQMFFNRKLDIRLRWGLAGLMLIEFVISIGQAYTWKSGWLPMLATLIVILLIGSPRFRVAGIVLVVLALILNPFAYVDTMVMGGEDYSVLTRTQAWGIILEIVRVNPIIGLGMSNYYWYTPLFQILGYHVQFNSHNNYIDVIAQTGMLGLVCFLWLFFEVWRVGWAIRDKVPDSFARAYIIGSLGGLVGTLVSGMLGDWILPFIYNVGLHGFRSSVFIWLFLGGLIALEEIYRNSIESGSAHASIDPYH